MKTQGKSLSKIWLAGVICLLFISVSCGSKNDSITEKGTATENVKAPKIDIHTAALTGDLEAIQQHIKAGSNLNEKESFGGSSPLISAALFNKPEIVEALIEAKANINQVNNDGSTALHSSAFFCNTEVVEILLANGADKSIKNNFGSTALESVAAPFSYVKDMYVMFGKQLAPMGLKVDLEQIEETRPIIVEMLK
ncbi:MAG: ankyrin repeat protein [Roseivirga sp.]|jgi:ankyrin repeat protein